MCLVPVLGRPEGKDGEFEAGLDHMVSLRLVWAVTKTASKQDMISLQKQGQFYNFCTLLLHVGQSVFK